MPFPLPSVVPSIRPGMSATTTLRPSLYRTDPTSGCSVVKEYAAIFGRARLMADSRLDLPAFGKPTSPASAISFSSSSR